MLNLAQVPKLINNCHTFFVVRFQYKLLVYYFKFHYEARKLTVEVLFYCVSSYLHD